MPPTHSSLADVAAAYRTLIAHETEPKEQDFYRTRLQRLEQATEPVCEFDCRSRVAAAGVGVYCPQCSAKCADTDLTTQLAKAIRAAWVDRLDWDELAQGALEFLTSTGRLLAADGLVLAGAEKAALERLLAAQTGIVSRDVYEAIECLRALFPATEPAEATVNSTLKVPDPAEPAEEETKAEGPCEVRSPHGDPCSFPKQGHAGVHTWAWPDKKPAGEATRAECVGDDYYCAQRDSAGNIRLNCGRGLLVAEAACPVNDVKEWWARADRGSKWERQ
ncbi:hypothetical protein, partial [Rhodococcus sp. JT-3]|uniref:hypothetical protein n=1 Tax=Rhodococcus sp. JT-3 TaxID=1973213 RepID=UPI001E609058